MVDYVDYSGKLLRLPTFSDPACPGDDDTGGGGGGGGGGDDTGGGSTTQAGFSTGNVGTIVYFGRNGATGEWEIHYNDSENQNVRVSFGENYTNALSSAGSALPGIANSFIAVANSIVVTAQQELQNMVFSQVSFETRTTALSSGRLIGGPYPTESVVVGTHVNEGNPRDFSLSAYYSYTRVSVSIGWIQTIRTRY